MASGGETREPRDALHQTALDAGLVLGLLNLPGVEYGLIGGFAVVIDSSYTRLAGDFDTRVRWGIEPETAIRTFFDARAQLLWLPQKECFERRTLAHVLVWLRVAPQHIL